MEKPLLTNSLRDMSEKDVFVWFQSMSPMIYIWSVSTSI